MQGVSNFWVRGWNPKVWPFKWKLLSSTFLWYYLLCCTRWFKLLRLWVKSLTMVIQISETYWAVRFCGTIYFNVQDGLTWVSCWNPKVWPSNDSFSEQYFPVVLFLMLSKVVQTFESVDKILNCSSSKKSQWAVLSRDIVLCEVVTLVSVNEVFQCTIQIRKLLSNTDVHTHFSYAGWLKKLMWK